MLLIKVSIVLSLVRIKSPRTEWVFTVITVAAEVSSRSFSLQKRSRTFFNYLPYLFTGENFSLSSLRIVSFVSDLSQAYGIA